MRGGGGGSVFQTKNVESVTLLLTILVAVCDSHQFLSTILVFFEVGEFGY